jgi:NAD(P)H-nitrite reductase large subunit
MLSAEPYLPINRPMLTKDLKTVNEAPETLSVHGQDWYDSKEIDIRTGVTAMEIHPETKTVITDSGLKVSYDKLIYATGAECFVPPFKGKDKEGVVTIRHLSDSVKLKNLMDNGKNAVVIGGGVLGLEAASELMRAGKNVTVLEATPQIIGRQVDAQSAAILKGKMEKMNVACYEGVTIEEIEGDGKVTGVRIATGEVFPADFVVVSCGNRGNVETAKNAGVEVARAIVVSQFMETNIPDIYACGDCCQFDNVNFQLWQEATNQGRVAGANATGDKISYSNQPMGLSLEGFGTSLYAIGDPGKKEIPYNTVETTDDVAKSHEKYWFFGNSLEGAVIIGKPEKIVDVTNAVTVHARHEELF